MLVWLCGKHEFVGEDVSVSGVFTALSGLGGNRYLELSVAARAMIKTYDFSIEVTVKTIYE